MTSQNELEILAYRLAISKLNEAIQQLEGAPAPKTKAGRPPGPFAKAHKKRTMSPEGRARIAAAQKARWAKKKGKKKGAAATSTGEGGGD